MSDNLDLLYIASFEMGAYLKGDQRATPYIEAQIFGGVSFSEDVASIRLSKKSITDHNLDWNKFCQLRVKWDPKNNIVWKVYDGEACQPIEQYFNQNLYRYSNFI